MNKKGQATAFVILGIVIFALVSIIFYVRQNVFIAPSEANLKAELDSIKTNLESCVKKTAEDPLRQIGLQGGYLEPKQDTYRLFNDTKISYLCYDIANTDQCSNRMLLLDDIKKQIDEVIYQKLISSDCFVSIKEVPVFTGLRNYNIITGKNPVVDSDIRRDNVLIKITYPIALQSKRSATKIEARDYNAIVNYPLGDLYEVSQDILDFETQFGEFDQLVYMLAKKGEYRIYKQRPYPDKLYVLKKADNDYIFQFMIQGEPGK
ncbi:hypothetical protein HYX19_01330 [Candidatus Woesearchaeota archaeon]|nr:hypothetical protein [Candidatus Woesearchaeota archaeon]